MLQRSRDLDSRGAARRDSGSDGAAGDASVGGGIRIRSVSRGCSVLSSDKGRSKGENGESGEREHEHGVACGVGVVCKGRMGLETTRREDTCRVVGSSGRLCLHNKFYTTRSEERMTPRQEQSG